LVFQECGNVRGDTGGEMDGVHFIDREISGGGGEDGRIIAIATGDGFEADRVFPLGAKGLDQKLGDIGFADASICSSNEEIHEVCGV
jgi:hypothetical protein